MKILFVHEQEEEYWKDGLWAALNILEKDGWQIARLHFGQQPLQDTQKYDAVVVWNSLISPAASAVAAIRDTKTAICNAGVYVEHPLLSSFDRVFVESPAQLRRCKELGVSAVQAFGTNTALFKSIPEQPKIWEAIYPAAFARWKRHYLFAQRYGSKGLAVGYMQPNDHERDCYDICLKYGTMVLPMVKPEVLVWLYNASKKMHTTASTEGGGARAIAEALSCGLEVEVELDNLLLVDFLESSKKRLLTEYDYAEALKKGLESL